MDRKKNGLYVILTVFLLMVGWTYWQKRELFDCTEARQGAKLYQSNAAGEVPKFSAEFCRRADCALVAGRMAVAGNGEWACR